jgi:hypothetical protein
MDEITDLRIFRYDGPDDLWGVALRFRSGIEHREEMGSRERAIAYAASLRRPPLLRVIEGGRACDPRSPEREEPGRAAPGRDGVSTSSRWTRR